MTWARSRASKETTPFHQTNEYSTSQSSKNKTGILPINDSIMPQQPFSDWLVPNMSRRSMPRLMLRQQSVPYTFARGILSDSQYAQSHTAFECGHWPELSNFGRPQQPLLSYNAFPDYKLQQPNPNVNPSFMAEHVPQQTLSPLHPRASSISQQMQTPRSVLRPVSSQILNQPASQEVDPVRATPIQSARVTEPAHFPFPTMCERNADGSLGQRHFVISPSRWTKYRVDREGTRISRNLAPPQGTYKESEGIGNTDYSDPRDFLAPTEKEQHDVWNALEPTRKSFHELTQITLNIGGMRCLGQGYNASWSEIKRKLAQWIFENFSPDQTGLGRRVMPFQNLNSQVEGYATQGTRCCEKQAFNPRNIEYFRGGELAVDVDKLLFKLDKWYGLIEDYEFSPTWPYERRRNAGGYLIQNRDCMACERCRVKQILCYGHREHRDRKCTPCVESDVRCTYEEIITENIHL